MMFLKTSGNLESHVEALAYGSDEVWITCSLGKIRGPLQFWQKCSSSPEAWSLFLCLASLVLCLPHGKPSARRKQRPSWRWRISWGKVWCTQRTSQVLRGFLFEHWAILYSLMFIEASRVDGESCAQNSVVSSGHCWWTFVSHSHFTILHRFCWCGQKGRVNCNVWCGDEFHCMLD